MIDDPSPVISFLKELAREEPELILDQKTSVNESKGADEDNLELISLEKDASACTKCELSVTRKNVVFGVGSPHADLMFIGEAPGADEDRLGEPFVGRAGKLLNRMLKAMEFERSSVYIANILKCRPPNNRDPLPNEAAACTPYLLEQIELIRPKVIVALGKVAACRLLDFEQNVSLKSMRGRIFDFRHIPFIITYHPAALLYTPSLKVPTWEDMQVVMKLLSGEISWQPTSDNQVS